MYQTCYSPLELLQKESDGQTKTFAIRKNLTENKIEKVSFLYDNFFILISNNEKINLLNLYFIGVQTNFFSELCHSFIKKYESVLNKNLKK